MIENSTNIHLEQSKLHEKGFFLATVAFDDVKAMFQKGEMNAVFSKNEWLLAKRYRTLARKLSWMAGQYAGKLAYQKMHPACSLADIEILRNEKGAPYISGFPEYHISISHSNNLALAVVSRRKVGVDMESIEQRPQSFINLWLTPKEQNCLDKEANQLKDTFVNQCWTMKEAYSKFLGIGGQLPFRNFCSIEHPEKLNLEKMSTTFDNYIISLVWDNQN